MTELKIYKARVRDIDDPDELGRIQVRVLPEMEGVERDLLPWVRPFLIGGMSKNEFSFNPPPIDSMVWVTFIDKFWKKGYYLSGQHIDGFFSYVKAKNKVEESGEGSTTYPNLKFYMNEDGSIIFHNTETGSLGVVHKNGSYALLSEDKIRLDTTGGFVEIAPNGAMRLDNTSGFVEIEASGRVNINNNLTVLA